MAWLQVFSSPDCTAAGGPAIWSHRVWNNYAERKKKKKIENEKKTKRFPELLVTLSEKYQ